MNEKFVKLSDIQRYPIRLDHCDQEHCNIHFVYGIESIIEYAESLARYEDNVGVRDWTECKDELPGLYEMVLCKGKRGGKFIGYIKEYTEGELVKFTVQDQCTVRNAVAWMPLPE